MDKPFVVCLMLTSLDGKIDGAYMSDLGNATARTAYGELRKFYGCQATLYGTVTMKGSYADGLAPALPTVTSPVSREDYLAPSDVKNYIVSVDPQGELGFHSGYIEKKGRPRAHVIEVLTAQVNDAYLLYLQNTGVSYIFAGSEHLDCGLLLHKLKNKFGIDRLMIAGGGAMNASFLQEDLIDELSLVISPLADGNTTSVSIFERGDFLPHRKPVAFSLIDAKPLDGDALWLRYAQKKETI